jgi:hypothetical protein
MGDARYTKKLYQANLHYKRPKRRSKTRWKYDVENDTRRIGMNWRKVAQDRKGWRRENWEVLILVGYYS